MSSTCSGAAEGIASVENVSGGVVGHVRLMGYRYGSHIVAKTSLDVPKDFFTVEAEDLNAPFCPGLFEGRRQTSVTPLRSRFRRFPLFPQRQLWVLSRRAR